MSISGADSEYSTPLQSHRTSRHLASPTSYSSVYYSAIDLEGSGHLPEMDIELISEPHEAVLEEGNGGPSYREYGNELHFANGLSLDFVLVSLEDPLADAAKMHEERRRVFEANLVEEGLIVQPDHVPGVSLRFVKIHAPFEVCTRYAEILKLRMPMLECDLEMRRNFMGRAGELLQELKVDEVFLIGKWVIHFPGIPAFEFNTPAMLQEMTDFFSRIFNFVRMDTKIFPPMNRHFTAVYSRDKKYLFDVTNDFFTPAIRARIVDFIIRRKKFQDDSSDSTEFAIGIEKLRSDGTYTAAYPIHDGDLEEPGNARSILYNHWAAVKNIYKYQPLDHVREYFGVKIGMYFAWLGFYTFMLIPAAIVGLFCFIYAVSTINEHEPSNDICNRGHSITMCPLCDYFCDYWDLQETCFHAKFTYLVDNPATIFFTCFMSIWAALFLEMWKRYSAEISHRWDLTGFDIHEEHPRPQYLARLANVKKRTVNIVTKTLEPRPPFWKMRLPGVLVSTSSVLFLVLMAIVAVLAVILYRMSVLAALSIHGDSVITSYAIIFTSATAAMINLFCIMIFNQIYARVAEYLTELELQRTQTEFDDSLTLKIYVLQFINYYSSIFYIAFVKGKWVGYPGDYNRVFGSRQEECSPGGCLLELSVQLAIIMVGKQAMNTVMEMVMPLLWKWYNMLTVPSHQREEYKRWPRWAKDFRLVDFDPRGLFPEYLEMVLQYGFVTIFVSSFPLAPLFAFLNNVLEMRFDAKKLLTHYRRPVSQRVKDIGVWFKILDSIGKMAVITNAFIIAFTSNFIPELVYRQVVSADDSLHGFLNHSLSTFLVDDYPDLFRPQFDRNVTFCRYPAYRNPPGDGQYKYAPIFWHILAARLAFVVVFENVVCLFILFIKWIVPDVPQNLQEQIRREVYVTNELIVEQELRRARGQQSEGGKEETTSPKSSSLPSLNSPLKRQMSEPTTRMRQNAHLRFASEAEPIENENMGFEQSLE